MSLKNQPSKIDKDSILLDHQDIDNRLKQAKELAPPDYVYSPLYEPEYFPIFDISGRELKEKGLITNWRAHLAGVRHKTSNVLLITQNGDLVVQQRASDTILFPSRYTVSAGGHMSYKTNSYTSSLDPLETIAIETYEELNLKLEKNRFEALGDPDHGLPNHLIVWLYKNKSEDVEATICVFDEGSKHIGIDVQKGKLSPNKKQRLETLIRNESMGKIGEVALVKEGITLFTRNLELCHFYTAVISFKERHKISFAGSEVAGYKLLRVADLIKMGKDLNSATDSLYVLFYSDHEIANELRRRVEVAKTSNVFRTIKF